MPRTSEERRLSNQHYEAKLQQSGIRKATYRLPAEVRHALRARAMVLGISENDAAIKAFNDFTKEPS